MPTTNKAPLLASLTPTVEKLASEFDSIPAERKDLLQQLVQFVEKKIKAGQPVHLNFICTHNSRRSHLSQIWAQAAAHYYKVPNVFCYSGGTEATAFNPRAVKAMQEAGFAIAITKEGENPMYEVRFAEGIEPVIAFSKKYDDPFNHNKDFAAIMTCSHADENCPLVLGASGRVALTYNDPKEFDGTPLEAAKYSERVHEIGREILFAFSQVNA
ncbi:protein-tyrosine-phosphatase [Chryseotalea sanaruensis]|uniref:Protein-tyrosine-phosphatase n=1 Tax=Chryseotalea sanaruensis TaxID=2482724 RepID=A0A401UCU6_9BACT|nr:protein-tyrosine-phosphatase [Chryseotalea sanaruensis]GCC52715.1 protein-tyrosine-phosphatase [Chryseotalea sanaruensis]